MGKAFLGNNVDGKWYFQNDEQNDRRHMGWGVFSDRTTLSMASLHGDKEKVEGDIDILFVS